MGKRRRARELAIQVLFHMEFNPDNPDESFHRIYENFDSSESIRNFSKKLVLGVCKNKGNLDSIISRSSRNWRLERMPYADRCILRLGVFEIIFMKDIPPKVSINEAVELGKKYGAEDSGAFINGILDNIYNKLELKGTVGKTG